MADFWLGYLDEAYTRTHYRIGVVLIAPRHVAQATVLLREVLDDARDTYALTHKAELHGYELFHGDKEWASTKSRRALQVVADHADAVVICGEHLDGQSLSTRERHQQVMTHVIADVDEFADVHRGHVLLIADDHEMVGQLRNDLALYQHNRPDSRIAAAMVASSSSGNDAGSWACQSVASPKASGMKACAVWKMVNGSVLVTTVRQRRPDRTTP